jgi:hypothetical protein
MAAVYPAEEESRGSITLVVRAATAELHSVQCGSSMHVCRE